ncbi:MAG: hypothetical protein ACW98I_16850 [Candidatus Hodarchaeales archaeon]
MVHQQVISQIDHDTNQISRLRPFADYGVTFTTEDRPLVGLLVYGKKEMDMIRDKCFLLQLI